MAAVFRPILNATNGACLSASLALSQLATMKREKSPIALVWPVLAAAPNNAPTPITMAEGSTMSAYWRWWVFFASKAREIWCLCCLFGQTIREKLFWWIPRGPSGGAAA